MFTKNCIDEAGLKENGIKPLVDVLEKIGGWPVVKGDGWNSNDWKWIEANKQMFRDGLPDDLILEYRIRTDLMDSSKRIIQIDRGSYGLQRKLLTMGQENVHVKAYLDFMIDAAVIFGADRSNAEFELLDSLRFEMELAKINTAPQYNPIMINELQRTYPFIDWLKYINWNLNDIIHVNESEVVVIWDRNYLLRLDSILQSTPKRTVANYFAWRIVFFSSSLVNDILRQRYQQFIATTTGRQKPLPRLTECVKRTMSFLPIATGAIYVRKYFHTESKEAVAQLVDSIHDELLVSLNNVSWMDEQTKAAAIAKARAMHFHIAHPNELADNQKLNEYYKQLDLQSGTLLHNLLRVRQFNNKHLINELRQPINKTDWETHSMILAVNAFYSHTENSILERKQFDLNGNSVNWWQLDTLKQFTSKTQCFVDQYSKYKDLTMNLTVNGVNTQGENIADNGAIKVLYAAYQKFIQHNGPDPMLPGLNYMTNQLFWISAAQTWCAVTRPYFERAQYMTNLDTPFKFRLIGSFSNSYNFSNDFGCATGSKMNPVDKCEIW